MSEFSPDDSGALSAMAVRIRLGALTLEELAKDLERRAKVLRTRAQSYRHDADRLDDLAGIST